MANELQSLSVLFQNRLFRIPDYQRGYAWKHEQLADFWDDLLNLHDDRYHYTGLLSLMAVDRAHTKAWQSDEWLFDLGYRPYHVVDGQQRLTTFSMLMFEIVAFVKSLPGNQDKPDEQILLGFESLKDVKAKYILRRRPPQNLVTTYLFGYETDNPSADYLKYRVFEEPYGGTVLETYYTRNLKYAKSFFAKNLKALFESEGIEGIERLYRKATLRLMFNLHEIKDDYDVFVAFETMNNRGKRLTNLELLKNRLVYLSTLFDDRQFDKVDKEQLRRNINDAWREVYYQLGRNHDEPLSDDDFLRAHWITYFRYSRRAGDDYIHFLLGKFSAKNVFERRAVVDTTIIPEIPMEDPGEDEDGDTTDAQVEPEMVLVSRLAPQEISDYVNSLKALAEHWYYSFFPSESELGPEEKIWIDRLNRIGIGYFRPLVVAALSTVRNTTQQERIALYRAVERFIFISFRIGGFQANYQSSVYYNRSREVLSGTAPLISIAEELDDITDRNMDSAVTTFIARTNRRFDSGEGFYSWRDLRYFLDEYEYEKAKKKNLQKVDWRLFSNVEKDRVTIEHILPQTPTNWYWRNIFRAFSADEIRQLSGSLGNLLPLSQSINSSLQNDSFTDKKNPPGDRRRGYINGSHSEIEVAQEADWSADSIMKRGASLLRFMQTRWSMNLTDEQVSDLLHIAFVDDGREVPPEIPEALAQTGLPKAAAAREARLDRHLWQKDFWARFVAHCGANGRGEDIASRKPSHYDWYYVSAAHEDYQVFFQLYRQRMLRIGFHVYRPEDFERFESRKDEIETTYGSPLEWYTSQERYVTKRVIHTIDADVRNPSLYTQHFDWLISQYDRLSRALEAVADCL